MKQIIVLFLYSIIVFSGQISPAYSQGIHPFLTYMPTMIGSKATKEPFSLPISASKVMDSWTDEDILDEIEQIQMTLDGLVQTDQLDSSLAVAAGGGGLQSWFMAYWTWLPLHIFKKTGSKKVINYQEAMLEIIYIKAFRRG